MKFNKVVFATLAIAAVTCSLATAKPKTKLPKDVANAPELIDHQLRVMGAQVPDWVLAVGAGDNGKIAKSLEIDEKESQLFVVNGRGNDLDFVKVWVDNIDARREVSTSISQVVATTAQATMDGMEGLEGATKEKMFNDAVQMASAIELNGLLKRASYWIKTRTLRLGANPKKAKDSDYTIEYTYYVVFTIDREVYTAQVNAAMNHLEENTSEESYLKRVLAEKLSQTIYPGNNVQH